MSETAPNPDFELLEMQPIEPGPADDDAEANEDQAIHLLLTAWTLVLEEEQQRSSNKPFSAGRK